MKPLTLTRKTDSSGKRLDLRGVAPENMQGPIDDIPLIQISSGGEPCKLGSAFDVTDGDRSTIRMAGDLSRCDHVGGSMQSGVLEVASSVGNYLASQMRGGTLRVRGDALDHAFSSMRGGQVLVSGNVGHYAGGGNSTGMRGGQAVVEGNAGRWLATRMRRGTIVVHGSAGPGAASRLIAGTLVICGPVEPPFGAGMKRGTVIFSAPELATPPSILPSDPPIEAALTADLIEPIPGFTAAEPVELSFLQLLLRELQPVLPASFLRDMHPQKALRALGDRAVGGQGEILWLRHSDSPKTGW